MKLLALLFAVQSLIPASEFQARRDRLAKEIGPNAMLVLFSAKTKARDLDIDYPYRQSDSMRYLTGIDQPEATLVILPGEAEHRDTIFVRDSNPRQELWTGHILTHKEVTDISGISTVESNNRLRAFINAALGGGPWDPNNIDNHRALPSFYKSVLGGQAELWLPIGAEELQQSFVDEFKSAHPDVRIRNVAPLLTAMREIKSAAEIAAMQKAIDISLAGQKAGMRRSKTATNEREVQAVIESTFRELGADALAYPSIVASGAHSTTLHYEEDDAPIDRNGLMLTDVGAEVQGYAADTTRTYPVSGKFTAEQRAIYDAVYVTNEATRNAMKPGALWVDVDHVTMDTIGRELAKLGLISKNEPKQVRMYLPYLVGHHIGLAVHDVWDRGRPLEAGMILTDEPGIYVRRDDVLKNPTYLGLTKDEQASIAKALDKYDGIGVRLEDEVLITNDGSRLLTSAAPRTAEEIERFMR